MLNVVYVMYFFSAVYMFALLPHGEIKFILYFTGFYRRRFVRIIQEIRRQTVIASGTFVGEPRGNVMPTRR